MEKKTLILYAWIIAVAIGITLSVTPISFQNEVSLFDTKDSDIPRAAIIDQLYDEIPNDYFVNTSTRYLNDAGYKVDVYSSDEITIDFYKKLPLMNYNMIIIRSHSLGEGELEESASLFTGEKYSSHKYIKEQFWGYVGKGVPLLWAQLPEAGGLNNLLDKTYFVIGSKFVEEFMVGQFNNSTIILGGCQTMQGTILANSFLKRGASEVIGWTDLVDITNNDAVILDVLKESLVNGVEIKNAVESLMEERDGQFYYSTTLKYHSTID